MYVPVDDDTIASTWIELGRAIDGLAASSRYPNQQTSKRQRRHKTHQGIQQQPNFQNYSQEIKVMMKSSSRSPVSFLRLSYYAALSLMITVALGCLVNDCTAFHTCSIGSLRHHHERMSSGRPHYRSNARSLWKSYRNMPLVFYTHENAVSLETSDVSHDQLLCSAVFASFVLMMSTWVCVSFCPHRKIKIIQVIGYRPSNGLGQRQKHC